MDPKITVTGNVGATPVVKRAASGMLVVELSVAHNRRIRNDGQWTDGPTTWMSVKCFGSLAQHVASVVKKGDPLVVTGRLEDSSWQNAEGQTRTRTWLVADAAGHDLTWGEAGDFERTRKAEAYGEAEPQPEQASPVAV